MKKKLIIVIMLCLSVLLTTACNNKKEESNTKKTINLVDYKYGTITMEYPSELGFSIDEKKLNEGSSIELYSYDYDITMKLSFYVESNDLLNEQLEDIKKSKTYKEYEWNGYKGYSYEIGRELIFRMNLYNSENGFGKYLQGVVSSTNNNSSLTKTFEENKIQDMLNTVKFNE